MNLMKDDLNTSGVNIPKPKENLYNKIDLAPTKSTGILASSVSNDLKPSRGYDIQGN